MTYKELAPHSDRQSRIARIHSASGPIFAPSLLACDFARMAEVLAGLASDGISAVHLDVMDGHFVPNFTYGAPLIADWRKASDLPFDTHLMMQDPGRYIVDFIQAGCDTLIFHIEAVPEPTELIRHIRRAGVEAGLSLNPGTPISSIEPFLEELDCVLVMSVQPGFGGQSFKPEVLDKVRRIKALRPKLRVCIDGGIKTSTAAAAVEAGCDLLVAGSAVFQSGISPGEAVAGLEESVKHLRKPGSA
ncbi:MAG: ribulose-phosphate 3-epimerase [Isosphaeraceae bacterium]